MASRWHVATWQCRVVGGGLTLLRWWGWFLSCRDSGSGWLLLLLCALGPCEASPQRLGPRFMAPFPAEYRFSNSTGGWLHCVSQGQPQPRVTWLLADGREAQPLGGLRRALPNGTLHFLPFRAAQFSQDVHGASYRCRATNLFGTVVSTEVRVRGVVEQYYEVQVYDEFTIAGNTAVLRCHVPSFVKEDVVVVSWEHKLAQKTEVIATGGRMSVFPSGELQVRRVQPSDASADFRCRTWHRLTGETKLSSYGRLVVTDLKVNVPPRITNVRSTVVARDGDTVELPCAAQGYPPPKYLWERLPTTDSLSSRRSVLAGSSRFEPSDGSLIIRKVEPEDAGKYLCLVSNGVGEERATVTLDVQAPLRVSLSPEVLTAHVGHPAVFRCAVSGRPAAEVHWAKDGTPLVIDRARIQLLDERQALRIGSVDTRDGGMYQCAASNPHESAQATAQLILGDTVPVLLESFGDSSVRAGDSVHLKCEATASPAPKITWTLDGTPVHPVRSGRVDLSEATRGEGHLVSYVNISRVKTEDGGLWQCTASNSAGSVTASARVGVYGPPAVRPFAGNRTAVATETLSLHCRLLSYPIDSVHWEKDGRRLPFHHRQKVFPNGTLLVLATSVQDAGEYACIAANTQGQTARAKLFVSVKVPPLIERFAFDENLHQGMRTRVYCNIARGDPPVSISWLRDGKPLKSGPDLEVRVLDAFSVALAIEALSPSHNGNYTCLASNAAASVNYTAPLRVHVPPHWIREPADTSAVEGHSASADCVADGHPPPRVTWQRGIEPGSTEYRQILSGPDYQVFENGTLRIAQVRVADRGSYLCQASNGVGTGLSTVITLKVHVPARFTESYRNQTVRRGHAASLECRALGDAPISISWSRNGRRLDTHKSSPFKVMESATSDGHLSTVSVSEAQRDHSGIFTCEVINDYGQDETQIRLLVQEPPEPPTRFNVSSVNSRSVSLTWAEPYSGNSPVISYLIQFKNVSASWLSGESSVHNITAGRDQTSWTVRGLQPAGTYHFRAAASNALGLGPFTKPPLLVVTDEEVPGSPPTEVSVQTLGPQSIKVTWKPPLPELRHGHIKGYYVGYKLHNSSELHLYKTVEARDADPEAPGECVLNNLRKHTKYSVLVQAYNAIGAGPRSDEAVVRTAQDVPQVAPPGVQCSSSSPTSLRVSWTKLLEKNLDGVHKGYRVIYRQIRTQHAQYEGFTGEEENSWAERDVNAGSSAAVLSSLEPYSNYSVRVAARTGAGAGAFSDPVHCSTPEAVPQAPEDIKALILAPDAILVSWKPPVRSRGVLLRYTVYSRSHGYREQAAAAMGPGSAAPPAADPGPARHVAVPSSQFWHETRGLRTGQRYEFWVTASTAAGEGPATRIVTQSPEIRAPARIASFNRDVSVALKQDLELPCRTVGQPMPIREWRTGGGALEETDRVRVLPSGTLRIESAEQRDSANYSCHAQNVYGRDSVHYAVHVHMNTSQTSPQRPASVSVLSTSPNSITLGWLKRNFSGGASMPTVREYELHYKRQQGSWDLVRVAPPASVLGGSAPARSSVATVSASWSNGTRLRHELTGLFCGTQYHIYLVAVGDKGKSDPSDTVFARTQGGVPPSPKQEAFVSPNASSLTLRPGAWSGPGCPVSHLAVEYRLRDGTGPWLVASRALQPREGPMTLHHLRPDTWYSVRVTAHSEAGPAVAEYAVRTLPASATLAATVHPELMVVNAGSETDGELSLLVPVATSLSLALAAAAMVLAYLCCRRRTLGDGFPKEHEPVGMRCASADQLAESALVKRASLDNVLSTLQSSRPGSYLASPSRRAVAPVATPTQGRQSISSIDDISTYTPFPDNHSKSNNGRIVLKKPQDQPIPNTRVKRPTSIQKLMSAEGDMQRKEKAADAHTPGAQSNHYDNPRATKASCLKSWQHTADKPSRPFVIPQETKSTLEIEPEGEDSPRWSRARRSDGNFINSSSAMIEKTYFFSGEEMHSEDVEAFCVALSPRMDMEYSSEQIKFS